jgi:hypothetical protein
MSEFRYLILLAVPVSAITFANAKDADTLNLVANCGFESGISDWLFFGATSNIMVAMGPLEGVVANSGAEFLALGNPNEGFMSQPLATIAGQTYNISWFLEVGQFGGASSPNDFSVSCGGAPVHSAIDLSSRSSYSSYSTSAVATSASTTLQFGFKDVPDYLILDDVEVKPVPEPGYFAVAGFALLAILFVHKLRLA